MRRSIVLVMALAFVVLAGSLAVSAKKDESAERHSVDETRFSGFMDDYSKLEPNPEFVTDLLYIVPGYEEKIAGFDSMMIDQPEIFIHPESKYKGMKPDDMKVISDDFRQIMVEKLKEQYTIVEETGPNVLYLRMAVSGLYLKKKRSKNPLSYTPIGLVAGGVKKAVTRDITKKISLLEANLEIQIIVSQTGEEIGAIVTQRGLRKDKEHDQKADPTSWDELTRIIDRAGIRLACRIGNARIPVDQRIDCLEQVRLEEAKN